MDLELHIQVARSGEAGGKVKFLVVETEGKLARGQTDHHVFKLKLKPVLADRTSSQEAESKKAAPGAKKPFLLGIESPLEPR